MHCFNPHYFADDVKSNINIYFHHPDKTQTDDGIRGKMI